jgi:hypothetical protein
MTYEPPQKHNTMSYAPPHKRNTTSYAPPHKRNTTSYVTPQKGNTISKSPTRDLFPQLAIPKVVPKTKMDFGKLFKNVEIKRKKREQRIKKGWIKLTKKGVVDSLTLEERKEEDDMYVNKRKQYSLEQLVHRWDQERELRLEKNGYLSDYSVDPPSDEEECDDYEEDEYEENEYEEEEEYEENAEMLLYVSKWFTS